MDGRWFWLHELMRSFLLNNKTGNIRDVGALTELEAQADDGQRDPSHHQQDEEAVSTQHLVT